MLSGYRASRPPYIINVSYQAQTSDRQELQSKNQSEVSQSAPSKSGAGNAAVTVLVLHWRGLSKTRQCLESLRTLSYQNYRVLVVANGAEEGDSEAISKDYPEVEVLSLPDNLGFAGGCNRGIEHALKGNADYIWLLNNDALTRPETVSRLVEALEKNEKSGASAALVLEGKVEGVDLREVAGVGKINFWKAKTYLRPLPLDASKPECFWLSGSNLMLKTKALEKVGLFDERFFLYFEDVDLGYRLKQAGYDLILVETVVEHEGNASTPGGLSLWRNYYHTRNRLLFFSKHCPKALLPIAYLAIFSHFLKHCLTLPLRGKKGRAKLYAEWLGLKDFLSGKFGRAACLDWCSSIEL